MIQGFPINLGNNSLISKVIPIEKAVICKRFVCYVYNLFVYVLTAYGCKTKKITEYKQSKLVRLHCTSCGDIIDTSLL